MPDTAINGPNGPLTGKDAEKYVERRLGFPMAELDAFPKWFLIETVNTCNARCIMCGIDFDKKAKQIIDDDLYEKIIAEIAENNTRVERVTLALDGEPLIDKKLAARIKRVKAASIETHISTNASLLNEKRSRQLIEAGLDKIYITIDSMKKDIYEQIRLRLDFDDVLKNTLDCIKLRNAAASPMMIRVQMVQQELNHSEADDFESYWAKILSPHDEVVVQKAHNWGNAVEVMAFGDEDEINNVPCIAPFGTFVVLANGDARLCCMDVEDTYGLGNLRLQSIREVWQGSLMQAARDKHLAGKRADIPICDGCTLWRDDKQTYVELAETTEIE